MRHSTKFLVRTAAAVSLTAAVAIGGARAQSGNGGQVEFGTFGSFTKFDADAVGLEASLGTGGRLGFYLNGIISIEAMGDYSPTEQSVGLQGVEVARLGATLLAHTRPSVLGAAFLGLGYGGHFYRGAVDQDDYALHFILGDQFSLGGRAALRIEGRLDYFPSSKLSAAEESALNLGATLGLSIYAFGGPPRDRDGDLVADKSDECPDTPTGAVVDAAGCPTDGDGDAVFDGLDQCPGTPSGAVVDDGGCPLDSDEDSVFDGIDVCPNTPMGAQVDQNGCPTDGDEDGVFDGLDQCPETPVGATVDASGCPSDGDGDGVFDGIDQCPTTPEGITVDETGCAGDDDGDGVNNSLDRCPNTPAGTAVDVTGCPVDMDGDGVLNEADQCPGTPPGLEVDERGCTVEQDSDGDGVPDSLDRCPNTPTGTAVDVTGCPVDMDGDGVLNEADQCPGTPPGLEVDERGCTVDRDTDGDGIPDSRDRCPNTAPGQNIDAVGCPILFVMEEQGAARPLVLQGVTFQSGRSALTPSSFTVLDEVAQSLIAHPEVRIEIAGHTDNTGSLATNRRLSLQRAQAVRAYLAQQGVEPSRMEAQGYGPEVPIAPNDTPEGRAQNRRVELRLLEGGGNE
jgi:outer membrane protein OmpA-like peptidoglycan-associated protein